MGTGSSGPGRCGVALAVKRGLPGANTSASFLQDLLEHVEVPTVGTAEAVQALQWPIADIEDMLQAAAALAFHAQRIVTRNVRDYRRSPVPALSPADFLKRYVTT